MTFGSLRRHLFLKKLKRTTHVEGMIFTFWTRVRFPPAPPKKSESFDSGFFGKVGRNRSLCPSFHIYSKRARVIPSSSTIKRSVPLGNWSFYNESKESRQGAREKGLGPFSRGNSLQLHHETHCRYACGAHPPHLIIVTYLLV